MSSWSMGPFVEVRIWRKVNHHEPSICSGVNTPRGNTREALETKGNTYGNFLGCVMCAERPQWLYQVLQPQSLGAAAQAWKTPPRNKALLQLQGRRQGARENKQVGVLRIHQEQSSVYWASRPTTCATTLGEQWTSKATKSHRCRTANVL